MMVRTIANRLILAVAVMLMTACSTEKTQAQTMESMEINITIGDKTYVAEIEETETGRAFVSRLPMTLNMSELNGNEKYYYLDESLPTSSQYFSTIYAGDLMLYGSSCIVLFYGNAGGYSYTRLGKLKSTEGLSKAVGSGNVNITFSKSTTDIKSVSSARKDGKIYAMDGTELKQVKGLFIKNGKKYMK